MLTVWGSRDLFGVSRTAQSRINLPQLLNDRSFLATRQEVAVKFYASIQGKLGWLIKCP